jgi:uncharacterized protein
VWGGNRVAPSIVLRKAQAMASGFNLKFSSDNQFMFTLSAANHEVVLTSETYIRKADALAGIASVKANAPDEARFDRRMSIKDEPYFVLRAANNQIVGTSQMYSSKAARDAGMLAVRREAPDAPTQDATRAG